MTYATGWPLLLALAVAIASVYAQVTVNDIVLARYTPPAWRGRIYALRFFMIFTSAGPAVWGIGKLYDRGGFDTRAAGRPRSSQRSTPSTRC